VHRISERLLDPAIALACTAALIVDGVPRGAAPVWAIVALSLLTCGPLIWRRRAPVIVLLCVALGLVACLVVFHPYDTAIVVAMVALYSVAVSGDRKRSLLVGASWTVFLIALVLMVAPHHDGSGFEGALMLVAAFAALAAGDAVRARRELRAAAAARREEAAEARRREADRRVVNERLRIARDLHDSVAHALVAINVRAGIAAHLADGPAAQSRDALEDIMSVSSEALDDLRATLGLLREADEPAPTSPGGPDLGGLEQVFERARAAGLDTRAHVELGSTPVPAAVQQAGFRIVQEALTNVMRHADASRASVEVVARDGTLTIEVTDDGVARNGEVTHGHGLQGMDERAAALGGEVVAGPIAAGGWRVCARLPLKRDAERQPA
jgi:signal transduction histidine kinase